MKRSLDLLFVATIMMTGAVVVACGEAANVDCTDVPTFSQVTAFENSCNACHSTTLTGVDRQGAPSDINFDTYEAAIAEPDEIVEVIEEGEMPPPEGAPITDEERDALLKWASCGTPE